MSYLIREGIHLPIILCKCQTVVSFFKRLDLYEQKNLQRIWTTSHLGCRNLPGLFVCVNVSQKCGQLNPWYWMAYTISRSWAAGIWTYSKLSDWDQAHTRSRNTHLLRAVRLTLTIKLGSCRSLCTFQKLYSNLGWMSMFWRQLAMGCCRRGKKQGVFDLMTS